MVESVISSPRRKKRGTTSRTMMFLRTMVFVTALPTMVFSVTPRVVARHDVIASG